MRAIVKVASPYYEEMYQLNLGHGVIGVFGTKDGKAELHSVKIQGEQKITVPTIKEVRNV